MYIIKILVQLSDGSFARLPIARYRIPEDGGTSIVKEESEREAQDWAKFILPGQVDIRKEEDS